MFELVLRDEREREREREREINFADSHYKIRVCVCHKTTN